MPPKLDHANSPTKVADGRYVHTFRQSWLNTYLTCPERARREAFGELERVENDAASVGTAVHATIEDAIEVLALDDIALGPNDLATLFDQHWGRMQDELDIRWVKRGPVAATNYGRKAAAAFAQVLPELHPWATEVALKPHILYADGEREIRLTGTIDYVDCNMGLVDWKTASRPYEPWQYQRWAIQPTVYTTIWRNQAELHRSPWVDDAYLGPWDNWTYLVLPDAKLVSPQQVPVERPSEWEGWLAAQLMPIAKQLEATLQGHLETWPCNDQHALCSPKWCPAFAQCKGKYVGGVGPWASM